jgi:hypothetical protein
MHSDFPVAALALLAESLENCDARWVVGGSTGLALRGAKLDLAPRDIDIYVDHDSVFSVHDRLSSNCLDGPEDNRTERYHSILSHYRLAGAIVELVGEFRVSAMQSSYLAEVNDFLYPNGDKVEVDGFEIAIVPLAHELLFNLLRERKDRAVVAGDLMAQNPEKHMPLLQDLIRRNRFSLEIESEAMKMTTPGFQSIRNSGKEEPI